MRETLRPADDVANGISIATAAFMALAPTLLLQARYSREHEREADRYGASMLQANGISPRALANILAKLEAAHTAKPPRTRSDARGQDHDENIVGDYLSSHPATRERIEALNRPRQQ